MSTYKAQRRKDLRRTRGTFTSGGSGDGGASGTTMASGSAVVPTSTITKVVNLNVDLAQYTGDVKTVAETGYNWLRSSLCESRCESDGEKDRKDTDTKTTAVIDCAAAV